MDDLKIFQKLRKRFADCLIDGSRTKAAADYHDNRLVGCKPTQIQSRDLISLFQLLSDRRSGKNCFVLRQEFQCLRKIAAYLVCYGNAQLIGQSRCHIRFMDNAWNSESVGCPDDRNRHESSFGEYDIRLDIFHDFFCFGISFQHTNRIRKIFDVKISAEFSSRYPIVWDFKIRNQFFLNPVIGADIVNIVAFLPQCREQGDIGRHMPGGSAASEDDFFHIR